MNLEEQFQTAAKEALNLDSRPDNTSLLVLYSFYKQGSEGDVSGKRPGLLDLRGRAKFDAWAKQKGTSKEDAMRKYVALVEELK